MKRQVIISAIACLFLVNSVAANAATITGSNIDGDTTSITGDIGGEEGVVVVTGDVGEDKDHPDLDPLKCDVKIEEVKEFGVNSVDTQVDLKLNCNVNSTAYVNLTLDNGEGPEMFVSDCKNKLVYVIPGVEHTHCSVQLPKNESFKVRASARLFNDEDTFSSSKKFSKTPTFDHDPQISISGLNYTPKKEEKWFGRGNYWKTDIHAKVTDKDLDLYSDGAAFVYLYKITNKGSMVRVSGPAKVTVISPNVSFAVKREFIKPIALGKPRVEGVLDEGKNEFVIKVMDAFGGMNSKFVQSEVITVNVVKN